LAVAVAMAAKASSAPHNPPLFSKWWQDHLHGLHQIGVEIPHRLIRSQSIELSICYVRAEEIIQVVWMEAMRLVSQHQPAIVDAGQSSAMMYGRRSS
jgi:hypothetical protein